MSQIGEMMMTATMKSEFEVAIKNVPSELSKASTFFENLTDRIVIIESPYASCEKALPYLYACCRHSLSLGEVPFASHGFYTLFLDDADVRQRNLGICCGYAFYRFADKVAMYTDLGMSRGMVAGKQRALDLGCWVDERKLGAGWEELVP